MIDGLTLEDYCFIDLSSNNKLLTSSVLANPLAMQEYIFSYLQQKKAQVAYGGYLEKRDLYKRRNHFKSDQNNDRNIHLGVDFWIDQYTAIHSPFDGIIHSFQDNNAFGDYGPTLILSHENDFFYTLYGHLSRESLLNYKVGKRIKKGEIIGYLGSAEENGNYAPHLHFQVIRSLQGKIGDYPGVCSEKEVEFYKNNCPDPLVYLGF